MNCYRALHLGRLLFCILIVNFIIVSFSTMPGANVSGEDTIRSPDDVGYYNITGRIVPHDAIMNTCCQSTVPDFNNTTGEFSLSDLKNGEYRIAFASPGYDPHVEIIQINGSDVDLGTLTLVKEGAEPSSHIVSVGPWLDGDGNGIPGINVSYVMDGKGYWTQTDVNGMAWIEGPVGSIPNGTTITASFQTRELEWEWNAEAPPYNAINSREEGSADNLGLIIIAFGILLVLIVATVVLILFFRRGNSGQRI